MYNIFIVDDDGNEAPNVAGMFTDEGYDIVDDIYDAHVVVFVGGEDVTPSLYNQHPHATTRSNKERDEHEMEVYSLALSLGIPMAGICRGGQFLNVMNGGKMYQDVDGHNTGRHLAYVKTGSVAIEVTSVHHQSMDVDFFNEEAIVLLCAGVSDCRETMSHTAAPKANVYKRHPLKTLHTDIEAVFYGNTNCLCFQPHPEYGHQPTKEIFFDFLNEYIFVDKEN